MAIDDNKDYVLTGAQVKDLANQVKARAYDRNLIGATSGSAGAAGLAPAPAAGDQAKFLRLGRLLAAEALCRQSI